MKKFYLTKVNIFLLNLFIACMILSVLFHKQDSLYFYYYVGITSLFLLLKNTISTFSITNKKVLYKVFEPLFVILLFTYLVPSFPAIFFPNFDLVSIIQFNVYLILPLIIGVGTLILLNKGSFESSENIKISKKTTLLILFFIILLFTIFKIPYLDTSFTGLHTMKYNSYVEPAKYMSINNDFTWYQKKYIADPLNNPDGVLTNYGHPPVIEWLLATMFTVFPSLSIEVATRLVMHIIGIFLIIMSFLVVRKFFSEPTSLLITTLIAFNPVITFTSFVTVQDSLCVGIMLLSLLFLLKYTETLILRNLLISSLILGIGIAIKYNLAVFAYPIFILFIFYRIKVKEDFIRDSLLLVVFSLIPFAISKTSIEPIPSGNFYILLFVFLLLGLITIYLSNQAISKAKFFSVLIKKLLISTKTSLIIFVIPIILFLLVINAVDYKFLVSESITDPRLIFNTDLYSYMLFEQFSSYLTKPIFLLFLVSLPTIFFLRKNQKQFVTAFATGSIVYWLIASKVIFFHNYYTIIILITMLIISANVHLYFHSRINKMIIVFITLIFVIGGQMETGKLLGMERKGFDEATIFLLENTEVNDLYFDESFTLSLTLSSDRGRVGQLSTINTKEVRDNISKDGFGTTMNSLGIMILVTENSSPDYLKWAALFSDEIKDSSDYRRTERILTKIEPGYQFYEDMKLRESVVDDKNISEKFKFVGSKGNYKFYTFVN